MMKINKYFFSAAGFLAGIGSGIAIMGLLAFSNHPGASAPGGGMTPVSAAEANSYFRNYMAAASPMNQVVKGFTIDRVQLDAMNAIARENNGLTGFRIYMGKDASGRSTAIVVGVESSGKDAVGNSIFNTDAPNTSPCPPVCDSSSPISTE
jgi:hypothetical protein